MSHHVCFPAHVSILANHIILRPQVMTDRLPTRGGNLKTLCPASGIAKVLRVPADCTSTSSALESSTSGSTPTTCHSKSLHPDWQVTKQLTLSEMGCKDESEHECSQLTNLEESRRENPKALLLIFE